MAKKKYELSQELVNKLAEISAGYLSEELFNKLLSLIEKEISFRYFTKSSEANLLRIILNRFDKATFLLDCVNYPHYIEILISIAVNSNYLTDILVRDPEYFYWIVNPSTLNLKLDYETFFIKIEDTLNKYKSFNAKLNALRSLKRKEILRIGVKDIFGNADLREITEELSILAKTISSKLFEICLEEIKLKNNLNSINKDYCLIALGKLGGNELNYSSDIDLIIFFENNLQITKQKDYVDILTEATLLFIDSSTSITEEGYIYRTDFRLRPDGKNSPLCRSVQDYIIYYETRGEDWERQMLIKAGFVGGNFEVYNKFISRIKPFVFPSTFSRSPLEQISRMKKNIERHLTDDENIKLIPGGIRDIEFSIQALQLLNGGNNKKLQISNSLNAIDTLKSINLLSEEEANTLKESYILYRKVEHYLQLMNDKQTHTIPAEGKLLDKLSNYLGFKSNKDFKEKIKQNRTEIIKIYNSIMGIEVKEKSVKTNFNEINYENKTRAERDIKFLQEGKGIFGQKNFDSKSINGFQKIEVYLFNYLKKSFDPDIVLQNFVRVISFAKFPSIWYEEFTDNYFFDLFLDVCQYSQKTIDLFAEDKELREGFLSRTVFQKLNEDELLNYSVKKLNFILSIQLTSSLINHQQLSKLLSNYFIKKIEIIANEIIIYKDFFIAGLGSFGTNQMTFASDIDLIFVTSSIETKPEVQKDFQKLLSELKKEFSPYKVDCRLRPEGKSGQLVYDMESYKDYLKSRARIWEFQAFTKLNFVCGNKKDFNNLIKTINKRLELLETENIKIEIAEMRKKVLPSGISTFSNSFNIKKSKGGITDIEYLVQFLILCNPELYNKCRGKGTVKIIQNLISEKDEYKDLEVLISNFKFLKKLELLNQNIFNSSSAIIQREGRKTEKISLVLNFRTVKEFNTKLNQVIQSNTNLYNKYLI